MKKIIEHIKYYVNDYYGPILIILLVIVSTLTLIFQVIVSWCNSGTYQAIEKVEIYENRELIETYTNVEDISGYTIYFEDGNKLLVNEHCNIKIYYVEVCDNPDSKYCPLNGDSND